MEKSTTRVMCVDDDSATLELRKVLLDDAGYTVLTAQSGAEALRVLRDGSEVDVVLLDYLMPGMNGDELAQELRKRRPDLRLIAVSAVGQLPATFLSAIDGSIQKGQGPEVLLSAITSVLAGNRTPGAVQPSPALKTILCVEDERMELLLRKALFESEGFLVLQANSASVAMQAFQTQAVDAVLLDYWLSGKNGTAVAEEMKQLRPGIPIVMLSGFAPLPGEDVVVDVWLRKGTVEPEDIVSEIKRLISRRCDVQPTANL